MSIKEPNSSQYEPEYRYQFEAKSPSGPHVVVQGSVDTEPENLQGFSLDEYSATYEVRLLVGPYWRDVQAVVPVVTIDGFWNSNADEDDEQRWEIHDLTWDTVGEFGPSNDELRIRLKFTVTVQGEYSKVIRLGYHLTARGRRLGEGGLNEPGPVKEQG